MLFFPAMSDNAKTSGCNRGRAMLPSASESASVLSRVGLSVILVQVFYKMAQFREDQFFAGKLTGLEAARHAKDQGLIHHAGCGPGKEGGRVDFLIAQLGKKGTKGGELFRKHGSDCFDSYVRRADPCAAGHEDCMRRVLLNDCANRIRNDILVIGNHIMKNYFMFLLFGPLSHPVSALVVGKAAGS